MNEEVFYGLDDDSMDHRIGSIASSTNPVFLQEKKEQVDDRFKNSNFNMSKNEHAANENDNNFVSSNTNNNTSNLILLKNPSSKTENYKNATKRPKYFDEAYDTTKRKMLPVKRKKLNINVWSILKDALGKDLSKFCVPGINKYYNIVSNNIICFLSEKNP